MLIYTRISIILVKYNVLDNFTNSKLKNGEIKKKKKQISS